MNLKKIGTVFTSKFVGTGPSSYKKRIYRAAVSQRLRNTGVVHLHQLGIWNLTIHQMTQPKAYTLKSKFPRVPTILINGLNRDVN